MRKLAVLVVLVCACGGGSDTPTDAPPSGDGRVIDGLNSAPMITSFQASPSQVTSGTPTDVTWTWTYAQEPTFPDPTCSIDHGVGAVTRGQTTSVNISVVTTFTLTCTNSEGMAQRQVVVSVPPVAPQLATFTATPATLVPGAPTPVTWAWTYSNTPSPAPSCMIDGVGTVTSGTPTTVTQTTSRVYRLRCTNTQGTAYATTNVNVDECTANTDDCGVNATCTDTSDGFTCACSTGFTGNGDQCNANLACGVTPSLCDVNAACINGTSCSCNPGFVGDGATCQRLRVAFTTSTTGTGNLSTWVGAGAATGLTAADNVCAARATAAGLQGQYVAWMSDSLNDAYCRANGFGGKKAQNCGQAQLPVSAGPWVRPGGTPFAPTLDRLLAPTRQMFFPASLNESGVEVTLLDRVYTGTDENGVYIPNSTCSDWTSSSSIVNGAMGEVGGGGGGSWTDLAVTDPVCSTFGHLRCVEKVIGPPLPTRHPIAKKAFITSVSGSGNFSTWADANAMSGLAAADAVCQARARYAGYANSGTFKAWMSSSSNYAYLRITSNGPWARPDGVVVALSEADLEDGRINAQLNLTELGTYLVGATDAGNVWTGSSYSGSLASFYCSSWITTSGSGQIGRHDTIDQRWTATTTQVCSADARMICLEDL
jgi:hypothetical protein